MTETRFALTTELITVTGGNYIVRASLCAQQNTITTALAAAHTVEDAEDRARQRVIDFYFQLQHLEERFPNYNHTTKTSTEVEKEKIPPRPTSSAADRPTYDDAPALVGVTTPVISSPPSGISSPQRENSTIASPPSGGASVQRATTTLYSGVSKSSLSNQGGTSSFETSLSRQQPAVGGGGEEEASETIDFSQIIEETTREMKRLGWTQEDGKKYLLETYGKKSRHLLTDEELMEFLNYLKSQPS
ncbi:MAG: hypothetical protein RML10_02280 [Geminocystis sp.]|nr:hypothetical protein [Geminocystis sp.]